MQGAEVSASGLLRFYSKDEVKRYIRSLVENYQAQEKTFGDTLGSLLRTLEQEKAAVKAQPKEQKDKDKGKSQESQKAMARGWVKMGSMAVNISDPNGALAEVLFQLHQEVKAKLEKASDALKSYEELNSSAIPEAGMYYLQVRGGVPEKVIVDLQSKKRAPFNFASDFKLV